MKQIKNEFLIKYNGKSIIMSSVFIISHKSLSLLQLGDIWCPIGFEFPVVAIGSSDKGWKLQVYARGAASWRYNSNTSSTGPCLTIQSCSFYTFIRSFPLFFSSCIFRSLRYTDRYLSRVLQHLCYLYTCMCIQIIMYVSSFTLQLL